MKQNNLNCHQQTGPKANVFMHNNFIGNSKLPLRIAALQHILLLCHTAVLNHVMITTLQYIIIICSRLQCLCFQYEAQHFTVHLHLLLPQFVLHFVSEQCSLICNEQHTTFQKTVATGYYLCDQALLLGVNGCLLSPYMLCEH